jgi:hypothetical protein
MSRRRKNTGSGLSSFLNLWVIAGAVGIALFLSLCTLSLLWVTRPSPGPRGSSTAILSVIRLPTNQPIPATQTPPPSPTDASGMPAPPAPGAISIGAYVKITGTSGEGLRLRSLPGFAGDVLLLGNETEVFQVTDGPKDADGYAWWYLTGASDDKRSGWAVANYLTVAQKP